VLLIAAALVMIATGSAGAECHYAGIFSRGISLASGEFNLDKIPGVYARDYIYPPPEEVDYYKTRGFDLVRLPFLWGRVQPKLFGELDATELGRIQHFTAIAHERCVRVILSPHNFGRYSIEGKVHRVGSAEVPNAAFADFWRRMAIAFKHQPNIFAFSLMNEPFDMEGTWPAAAQAGLDAIRKMDATRLVLAPGDQWSGAWSWRRFNDDFVLNDPAGRVIYEAHQYFDADHSGTYEKDYDQGMAYPSIGIDLVRPFVDWLHIHHASGIIGEFGVPNNDARWLEVINRLLPWLGRERVPWVYWAGGPWWGDYPLSAEPKNGSDAPIMRVLTKYRADIP
jgi:endoglucanase